MHSRRSHTGPGDVDARPHFRLELKFAPATISVLSDHGAFEGYASLFGKEDLGNDIVLPGAFKASIARRGATGIKLLYQHDPNDPIGVFDLIREDPKGLFVRGRILTETRRGGEVLALMESGALDGLSIGYHAMRSETDANSGARRLIEVDLWEISIVTFPMLPAARAQLVRPGKLPSERKFERWLTRDAGFSRSQARSILAKGYRALAATQDAGTSEADYSPLALRLLTARAKITAAAFDTKNQNH